MLTPTLLKGGEFPVLSSFDVTRFLETIERERITATFVAPSMIYDLLDKAPLVRYDLSSLEMIIYGASPISPVRLREAIRANWAQVLPALWSDRSAECRHIPQPRRP